MHPCAECPLRDEQNDLTAEQTARLDEQMTSGTPFPCHLAAGIAKEDIGQRPIEEGERACVLAEAFVERLTNA